MLEVNVKKNLGDQRQKSSEFALDIAFKVESGITVLVGASGSGKTTTLRMIAGIISPDAGVIRTGTGTYFDSDNRINLPIQQRRVGFVFQDYALFPHLTGERNVAYGIRDGDKKSRINKAIEMLALFHVEYVSQRLPYQMSGGEQQRVALARALASQPEILLLDEPLSAVDVETRSKLLDEIEAAHRRTNIPFVYVTHNETEATRLGTTRITLRKGRVVSIS